MEKGLYVGWKVNEGREVEKNEVEDITGRGKMREIMDVIVGD